jgi:cyclopropane-fatty-acyl-phospholipid synthase
MLFLKPLQQLLRFGTITVVGPDGSIASVAATAAPMVRVRLKQSRLKWQLLVAPSFYLPESYVNGTLEIEEGDLRLLLTMLIASLPEDRVPTRFERVWKKVEPIMDRLTRTGDVARSARDVQYHYDKSNDFYRMFLDSNMQYSCAYFEDGDETLEQAQHKKMAHIVSKLNLKPKQNVLDIGSGWGALANFIAANYDVDVKGVTLSLNQYSYAKERTSGRVTFDLHDYRKEDALYDRIVSVGMLEHVGQQHYGEFFAKIASLLRPDGLALIHTIGRRGPPTPINPWIRKRIFPGSYLPSLSQLTPAIEAVGLWMLDCENLRLHYARTLNCWFANLKRHEKEVRDHFGERFFKAWEYYLVSCELGFRHQGLTVYQILIGKSPDAAPLSRNFMFEEEVWLRERTEGSSFTVAPMSGHEAG